jgi:hypothetical protein
MRPLASLLHDADETEFAHFAVDLTQHHDTQLRADLHPGSPTIEPYRPQFFFGLADTRLIPCLQRFLWFDVQWTTWKRVEIRAPPSPLTLTFH